MGGELEGPGPEERPHPTGRRTSHGVRIDPEVEVSETEEETILSALVEHEPGVLANIAGLFSRRQFNIEGLSVGPTEDPELARITITIEEPPSGTEQAKKQLRKLMPVRSVTELDTDATERELALIKVDAETPDQVRAVAEMYNASAVDVSPETITIEITGPTHTIDNAVETFERFGIREIVRTGRAALASGPSSTN